FAIENTGTAVLTISLIQSSTSDFTVSGAPTSVGIGATETFTVTLGGSSVNTYNSTIIVNNNDGDEDPFTFPVTGEIDATLGIHSSSNLGIEVYPNPTKKNLNIVIESLYHGKVNYILRDISGRVILSMEKTKAVSILEVNIPFEELSNGIFILEVSLENGKSSVFNIVKRD
ncbi:MAG: T9SS type A sorting domain-containing protein, partial [Cytophagales bacterium]|nr:T9SS type A sorting domain-containing protein [Cytophagales bacterium]